MQSPIKKFVDKRQSQTGRSISIVMGSMNNRWMFLSLGLKPNARDVDGNAAMTKVEHFSTVFSRVCKSTSSKSNVRKFRWSLSWRRASDCRLNMQCEMNGEGARAPYVKPFKHDWTDYIAPPSVVMDNKQYCCSISCSNWGPAWWSQFVWNVWKR